MMNLTILKDLANNNKGVRVELVFINNNGFNSSMQLTMDKYTVNRLQISCESLVKEVELDELCLSVNNYNLYNVYFDACDRDKVEYVIRNSKRSRSMYRSGRCR